MKKDFIINNLGISAPTYTINEFIELRKDTKDSKKTRVYVKEFDGWKDNINFFFYSLLIAIPQIHLDVHYRLKEKDEDDIVYSLYKDHIKSLNSYMSNYYFDINGKFDTSYYLADENDIEKIKSVFDMVIEYNKERFNMKEKNTWEIDRYLIAYNHYLDSYRSLSVELSIQNMITVLEALLVEGSGELNFRVALYTSLIVESDKEKRYEIFNLIKYMYDIRSKSVHGEIMAAAKKLKTLDYDKYYKFKRVVSEVLIKTYKIPQEDIFMALKEMIYSSSTFESYLK